MTTMVTTSTDDLNKITYFSSIAQTIVETIKPFIWSATNLHLPIKWLSAEGSIMGQFHAGSDISNVNNQNGVEHSFISLNVNAFDPTTELFSSLKEKRGQFIDLLKEEIVFIILHEMGHYSDYLIPSQKEREHKFRNFSTILSYLIDTHFSDWSNKPDLKKVLSDPRFLILLRECCEFSVESEVRANEFAFTAFENIGFKTDFLESRRLDYDKAYYDLYRVEAIKNALTIINHVFYENLLDIDLENKSKFLFQIIG